MSMISDPNFPLLESAREMIANGQLANAAAILNQARSQIPNDPRVFMMAAIMSEKSGNIAAAFHLMQRGLELAPNWAPGIIELAQLQARQGHIDEALENADTALQLDAESHSVIDGSIHVAHLTGQIELAVHRLRQGLIKHPADTNWQKMLANDLSSLGRYTEALAHWDELIAHTPGDPSVLEGRMRTLLTAGRLDEAATVTTALLALDPENPIYAYYNARAHGQTPAHQPAALNRHLFDSAAYIFDQQLVEGLRYRLPQKIAHEVLARYPDRQFNLLDLGCGTGLLGAQLGKIKGRLVGIDVSPNMLAQAGSRNLYDRLEVADLHDTLRGAATASYDVITALDVYVYAGDPSIAIPAAWRVLTPGGWFIFSCESGAEDGPDLRLNPKTERYVHKRSHVESLCRMAGFNVEVKSTTLRYQAGQPVPGFVVMAHKAA